MGAKKYMVYFLLVAFLMARVEPVFPYLKSLPKITRNLISNITALCTGSDKVNILADVDLNDDDQDSKDAEKEGEKEACKTIKEEFKMLLHDHTADLIFTAAINKTQFHIYLSGKARDHVNKVFRPPLV